MWLLSSALISSSVDLSYSVRQWLPLASPVASTLRARVSPASYSALPLFHSRSVSSGQKGGFDSLGLSPISFTKSTYLVPYPSPLRSPVPTLRVISPTLQEQPYVQLYIYLAVLRTSFCGIPPSYRPQLRGAEKAASNTEYAWAFVGAVFS